MDRRSDWNELRRYTRRLGIRLIVLPSEQFSSDYDPGIRSLYDPRRNVIIFNRSTLDDEDIALFALAHEIGHAIDHLSEPHLAREYGLHYNLAQVYFGFGLDLPDDTRRVFQDREDMANDLAESLLGELRITISAAAREACVHH